MTFNFIKSGWYFSRTGFTLVDLLVSIGIVVILATFTMANFRGTASGDLKLATQKVGGDIRSAQVMGSAGKMVAGSYPAGGYGLVFEAGENTYQLFADKDADGTVSSDEIIKNIAWPNFDRLAGIFYTDLEPLDEPVLVFSSGLPTISGWIKLNNDELFLIFGQEKTAIGLASRPDVFPSAALLLLENSKGDEWAYLYFSQKSGLINFGPRS